MFWVIVILSIVIASVICKALNRNTIGTTGAYVKRAIVVWFIIFVILWEIGINIGFL